MPGTEDMALAKHTMQGHCLCTLCSIGFADNETECMQDACLEGAVVVLLCDGGPLGPGVQQLEPRPQPRLPQQMLAVVLGRPL